LGNFNAKKVIDIIDASIIGFFKDSLEYSENKNKADESNSLNQNLEYFCAKYFVFHFDIFKFAENQFSWGENMCNNLFIKNIQKLSLRYNSH
jgi:hypothetical protein